MKDDSSKLDSTDWTPAASGLSDEDIYQLLRLIRAETQEKIISINSTRDDAEVTTGFLANGEAGEGHCFECVRTEHGWKIAERSKWIA